MNKSSFDSINDLQLSESRLHGGKITEELLEGESHILQLIFARAPLSKILNEICYALNCQIGNIVSVVTLSDRDRFGAAETAQNAAIFGLFGFLSMDVVNGSGKLFATLDLYSSVSRAPTSDELQWISRAVTLAAIAFTRRVETPGEQNIRTCLDGPKPEFKPLEPVTVN